MPGGPIGAALVPRRVYADVGTYDENLASLEDWDFVIRVLHRNWKARSIDKPLHKYRMHSANKHARSGTWGKDNSMKNIRLCFHIIP
jgi:hypothetical protein